MKKIYSFQVNQKTEVEEPKTAIVDGKEFSRPEKVTKEVPKTFVLKKPSRIQFDEAELFHGSVWSDSLKHGMLTEQLLFKRYADDGGIFSKEAMEKRKALVAELGVAQREYEQLEVTAEKTEELKAKIEVVFKKIAGIREQLINYEQIEQSLYQNTAEARARAKTTIWWVLQLAYKEDGEKTVPLFGDGSYEDRLKVYDEYNEGEDIFWIEVVQRFLFYTTLYLSGRGKTDADFKEVEKLFKVEA